MRTNVAIIGAGSAGLSALREVKQHTGDYVLIDEGPLGTKCARTGCMPSKVLINVAKNYHRRRVLARQGLSGSEHLKADIPAVMRHVRLLRDHFAGAMAQAVEQLAGDRLVRARAKILSPNRILAGDEEIHADAIVIATGSRPTVPRPWQALGDRILTSDTIFEQQDLPPRIAVVGLGPVGLELGQALARLGIELTAFGIEHNISALTDPHVNEAALSALAEEFPVHTGAAVELQKANGGLLVKHPDIELAVDAGLVAVGSAPDIAGLGLENLNITLDSRGLPRFDVLTSRIEDLSVFIAGDADGCCPILHEAIDEGFIAGYNCATGDTHVFCRRTRLQIVFTDPQIAVVGQGHRQLQEDDKRFVVGKADFADQSRAVLELHAGGLLHVYVDRESSRLLGAEMACPDAEHIAHLLALAMHSNMTVYDMLHIPFYHPTAEEGLRTALRDAVRRLSDEGRRPELSLCGTAPEAPLC